MGIADVDLTRVVPIAAAALGGAAIGAEREWSGHASGPGARFAGIRTFTLLGAMSGMAGVVFTSGAPPLATVLLAATTALVVVGYAAATPKSIEATTEVAALVVVAAGVLDGLGELRLASGIIAVTWLVLLEKSRVHDFVRRIDDAEMRAAARFAVMAVVVLPLLPEGPYGPWGGVKPRALWTFVLLFSGLSFAGFVARRAVGAERGVIVAGMLGGLVSSTAVTFAFGRASKESKAPVAALAVGAVAASTVMFPRLLVLNGMLQPSVALAAAPTLLVGAVVGVLVVLVERRAARAETAKAPPASNPLELGTALKTAAVLQLVLFLVTAVRERFGDAGFLATSALVGLTDTDALTLAVSTAVGSGVSPTVGAQAIAYGSISNTVFKLGAAIALGAPAFARRVAIGLLAIIAALLAASFLLLRA
jgi:uncharacterized membrane protein (DUF4010 family)